MFKMLSEMASLIAEVATELFSGSNNEELGETYKYWMKLDYAGQEYYFNNNEYLKPYLKNDYYPNDRHLTAKHVQAIADKLNKEFTNISNRY